jgi:hypothetical protein
MNLWRKAAKILDFSTYSKNNVYIEAYGFSAYGLVLYGFKGIYNMHFSIPFTTKNRKCIKVSFNIGFIGSSFKVVSSSYGLSDLVIDLILSVARDEVNWNWSDVRFG